MSLNLLTKKERLVFYNLVKQPDFNDGEISRLIDVKRSTVTAIRNRLKAQGFYSKIVIPNLQALGCRLLGIYYGKYNPLTPLEERVKASTTGEDQKHPELVFARSTDTEFIKIYVAEHLADIRGVRDKIFIDYESHNFIEDMHSIFFPFELCNISSLFNYVPLMGKLVGIEPEEADYNNYIFNGMIETGRKTEADIGQMPPESQFPPEKTSFHPRKADLTNVEKSTLDALVANPEASIVELSKMTKKTRSTVSRVISDLKERKLIQTICLPTLEKLGCELMVFIHTKFNPKSSMETRKDEMKTIMKAAGHVFKISGNIESAGILIPRNYTEYVALYNEMISLYRDKGYISENPYALLLPVQKIKWKKLDFSAITHKMLFERM